MEPIRIARAVGGLLAVAALCAVLVAHVVVPAITVPWWIVGVMLSVIGALLGVDIAWDGLPVEPSGGSAGPSEDSTDDKSN